MLGTILVIILILLLVGALPTWPYSTGWGLLSRRGTRYRPDNRYRFAFNGTNIARNIGSRLQPN